MQGQAYKLSRYDSSNLELIDISYQKPEADMDLKTNIGSKNDGIVFDDENWPTLGLMDLQMKFDVRKGELSGKKRKCSSLNKSYRRVNSQSLQCELSNTLSGPAKSMLIITIILILFQSTTCQQNQQQQQTPLMTSSNEAASMLPQIVMTSRLLGSNLQAGQPSQLFLPPPANGQNGNQAISLVGGFNQKKPEEEEDGFIMQSASLPLGLAQGESTASTATTTSELPATTQTDSTDATTSTYASDSDETTTTTSPTTTIEPDSKITTISSEQDNNLQGRIPIDVNRQQFVTHDQLSLPEASTKDENMSISQQSAGNSQSIPPRAPTSRSGASKVSHVSSILSGKFLPAHNLCTAIKKLRPYGDEC